MKLTLEETDLGDIIYENQYPLDFYSPGMYERQVDVNHRAGKGIMTELGFDGVFISNGKLAFADNHLKAFAESNTPLVEMHFNISGYSEAKSACEKSVFRASPGQNNLLFSPGFSGVLDMKHSSGGFEIFEIHLSQNYFERLLDPESVIMNRYAESFQQQSQIPFAAQNGVTTPQMKGIIADVLHTGKTGVLKRIFLEAKVLELFSLQLEQLEAASNIKTNISVRKNDIDKIHHARYLISENIANPLSLSELSRRIGLNDFKLKKGFKELFGTTVFGYLYELRMQQAKVMFLEHKKTVHEVSEEVGYKNAHHFTTAFKKMYGILPSQLKSC